MKRITSLVLAAALLVLVACGDDDPVAGDPNGVRRLGTIEQRIEGGNTNQFDRVPLTATIFGAPIDIVFLDADIFDGDHEDSNPHGALIMDSTDPLFAFVVGRLTDGGDHFLEFEYIAGGNTDTIFNTESVLIDFDIARETGEPDFVGCEITALRWAVDLASIKTPGSDPNQNGMWTDYEIQSRIIVEGRPGP